VTRRRAIALAAVWLLPSAILVAYVAVVYRTWRIEVPPRLGPEARAAVVASLRAALDGQVAPPTHAELGRRLPDDGPLVATLWLDGVVAARVEGYGATIAAATAAAGQLASAHPQVKALPQVARARARWKVDVVVGRGPVERDHTVLQLVALHPGVDGLGATIDAPGAPLPALLLPDEMFLEGLLAKKPLTKLMPEIGMGVDFARADFLLARRSQRTPAQWKTTRKRYFRFRTDAFVETTGGVTPPLQLTRGLPPGPPVTAAGLRAAALAGARYLVDHLGPDGRYVYEQNLTTGRTIPGYSLPRHAGTTYFLAEVYRFTKAAWLREPIERAATLMVSLSEKGGCKRTLPDGRKLACVLEGGRKADLGSTALGVVALAEYQRATGDTATCPRPPRWRVDPVDAAARRLVPPHLRRLDRRRRRQDHAAVLLGRGGAGAGPDVRDHRRRPLRPGQRARARLAGGLVRLLHRRVPLRRGALDLHRRRGAGAVQAEGRYRDFCDGLARFWGQSQAHPGDYPDQPDLVGSHNLTPFVMPHNTPAGSHTEARISTYLLGAAAGRPHAWLRADIVETLGYLMAQQIGPHNDYALAPAARAFGALATNPVDRTVRIDYVQHVCSAMIRGAALIE
jgi:hypothetical protein